jgi:hypothetical protein
LSAEKLAAMKISFTGVKCRIHGYRRAKARAYSANSTGNAGVLEPAQPRRHPEVTEVRDDGDLEIAQPMHLGVADLPVVRVRGGVDPIVGRAVAQRVQPGLAHEREVLFPAGVVPALVHLIYAHTASDRWIAVLDAGGEEEGCRRHHIEGKRRS